MSETNRTSIGKFVGGAWWLMVALIRLGLTLLILAVILGLLFAWWNAGPPPVPERAALVIAPRGILVEQLEGDAMERAWDSFLGLESNQTLVKDLVDAIEAAARDDRIQAIYLSPDDFEGGGLTKQQRVRRALSEFKKSGKKVVAAGAALEQNAYHLASAADEILLHPSGAVLITGYDAFRSYYKDGLDRLMVDWNVFRVGEYKSYVEPFVRNDMSDEARTATMGVLDDLWAGYLGDVAPARGQSAESFAECIDQYDQLVADYHGDMAQLALELGWVDGLATRAEVRDRMIDLVGESKDTHSFNQIGFRDYLESAERPGGGDGPGVGILVASGEILDGDQPPGSIGGDSTAALIREARYDDDVKALVLRVDSGGGSAFASEVIRQELQLLRDAGKPVVVSMGSVAASGGYWIATASDRILAQPATVTGSIGIFGMLPTFQRTLSNYLGVNNDGVGTTRFAGALRLDRALNPALGTIIQEHVNFGYQQFLKRVASNRGKSVEAIDRVAQGRVWSGQDALELGLVDQLGDLEDAVRAAAEAAQLEPGHGVKYLEPKISFSDQLMIDLLSSAQGMFPSGWSNQWQSRLEGRLLPGLRHDLRTLQSLNDPMGVYALCWCPR